MLPVFHRKDCIYILLIAVLFFGSCKKEDPAPVDVFVGNFLLEEVIEEFKPTGSQTGSFIAPSQFEVTKSDFLDPSTGERITAYKFLYDDKFLGLASTEDNIIVGTSTCPNASDLKAVSITYMQADLVYQLHMVNCEGREVLANYNKESL